MGSVHVCGGCKCGLCMCVCVSVCVSGGCRCGLYRHGL